ncbi:uncharacterized protein LOC129615658 [Condylostylus longicornis]|uniref:uncharacterized protein LOC129615658 n=1 Tax=Condylostylus longicornis TaxID=2530218 RepID=UPI00244E0060|nr:uncharacterized protein LOC129615658 [Condylostylus longicornis]
MQYNRIIQRFDENSKEANYQTLFNQINMIKEEIKEIVRAVQLAKGKIVNTNLLNKEEINQLISEMQTLPYFNVIDAIEYATPTVVVQDMTVLYILSLPKTSGVEYNYIKIRATTKNNKQLHLTYKSLLTNLKQIFGISNECNKYKNTFINKMDQIQELPDDHCITQILRNCNNTCEYEFNRRESVEIMKIQYSSIISVEQSKPTTQQKTLTLTSS